MDMTTKYSYLRGTLPDRYWYQLNGKSAAENYIEQRYFKPKDETTKVIFESKIIVK